MLLPPPTRVGFRVIPVTTIDQGIAALTGVDAGRRGRNGQFPKDSINGLVEAELRAFAMTRHRFGLPYDGVPVRKAD